MSLILVRSPKHAKLIKLEESCDSHYIKWHRSVEQLEKKWDEMVRLDDSGFIEESRRIAMEANTIHAKSLEYWFDYVHAREKYIQYEETVSGSFPTAKLRHKL